ncbi:hypothetical protein [Nonomuraea sp. B19D2]
MTMSPNASNPMVTGPPQPCSDEAMTAYTTATIPTTAPMVGFAVF